MLRLGKERDELKVVSDQIGTPTYAADLATAIYKILISHQWVPGIYHYTNSGVASWYDFTKAIHRISGITGCNVKPIPTEGLPHCRRKTILQCAQHIKNKSNLQCRDTILDG